MLIHLQRQYIRPLDDAIAKCIDVPVPLVLVSVRVNSSWNLRCSPHIMMTKNFQNSHKS